MNLGNIKWKFGLNEGTEKQWVQIIKKAAPRTTYDARQDYLCWLNNVGRRYAHEWTPEQLAAIDSKKVLGHVMGNYDFDAVEVSRIVNEYAAIMYPEGAKDDQN